MEKIILYGHTGNKIWKTGPFIINRPIAEWFKEWIKTEKWKEYTCKMENYEYKGHFATLEKIKYGRVVCKVDVHNLTRHD